MAASISPLKSALSPLPTRTTGGGVAVGGTPGMDVGPGALPGSVGEFPGTVVPPDGTRGVNGRLQPASTSTMSKPATVRQAVLRVAMERRAAGAGVEFGSRLAPSR